MLHSHYYYFRRLGPLERSEAMDEAAFKRGLFEEGKQRPILIGDEEYQAFKRTHADELLGLSVERLHDALLLMPGPYAVCDPSRSATTAGH
jgi:hypothetical protein